MTASAIPLSGAAQIYQQLEQMIVLTELKPGMMYTEMELARILDAGRTPVREALQRLAGEGLVAIIQRRGIQITEIDLDTQLNLLEVRRPIQNLAADCAAKRAADVERTQLLQFADELAVDANRQPRDRAHALSRVRRAHDLVIAASHNPFVEKSLGVVKGLSQRFWVYHLKPEDYKPGLDAHVELLRAVAGGEPDQAIAASNRHMDYLEAFARGTRHWH